MTRFIQILSRLKRGREYREAFVASEITVGLPFQIRAIRESRGWTQKDLARRLGTQQSVVSQLENPGYGKLTLTTLRKLAAAFDVALMVRFVPFSELVGRAANLSDKDFDISSFDKDLAEIEQGESTDTSLFIEDCSNWLTDFDMAERIGPRKVLAFPTGSTATTNYLYDSTEEVAS